MSEATVDASESSRGRPLSPEMKFVLERLGMSPDASFQQVAGVASLAGMKLTYPVYARAKVRLGLTKKRVAKLRAKVLPTQPVEVEETTLRSPQMPIASPLVPIARRDPRSSITDLDALIAAVREIEEDR